MSLQEIFYFIAIIYLLGSAVFMVYIYFQITKLIEFIRNQKRNGQEILLSALQAKYGVQISALKFFLKLLKGGEKYE